MPQTTSQIFGSDGLLNSERLRSDLAAGKINLEQAKKISDRARQKTISQESKDSLPELKVDNDTVETLLDRGELLPSPKLLDDLKSKKITIGQALDISKIAMEKAPAGATPQTKDGMAQLKEQGLNLPALEQKANEPFSYPTFIAQKLAQGATFDIYDPKVDAPTTTAAMVGLGANILGGIVSGSLFSMGIGELGALAGAGKIFGAAKKSAALADVIEFSTDVSRVKKAKLALGAINASKVAAEGAIIGGTVEGIKTSRKEDATVNDVVANTVVGGIINGAMSMALYPALAGAGKVFSAFSGKTAKTELMAQAVRSDENIQSLVKTGDYVGFAKRLKVAKAEGMELNSIEQMAVNVIDKIDAVEGFTGSPQQLLKFPEIIAAQSKDQTAKMSRYLFKGFDAPDGKAPLGFIYDQNPNIKTMVDAGHHAEAIDLLQSELRDKVLGKSLQELATGPLAADNKIIGEVYVNRFLDKTKSKVFANLPEESRVNLIKYIEAPTPNNSLLEGLPGNGAKQFKRFVSQVKEGKSSVLKSTVSEIKKGVAIEDVRLSNLDADTVVKNVMTKHFQAIGETGFDPKLVGALSDTNQILKSAIHLNKTLHRGLIDSFRVNDEIENMGKFSSVDVDDLNKVQDFRRIIKEQNDLIVERRNILKSIGNINQRLKTKPEASDATMLIDLTAQEKRAAARISDLRNAGKGLYERLKTLNTQAEPNRLSDLFTKVDDMWAPSRKQFATTAGATKGFADRSLITSRGGGNDVFGTGTVKDAVLSGENPMYIRKDSELADALSAMSIIGRDMKPRKAITFLSPQREIANEFGVGSPVYRGVIEKTQAQNALVNKDVDRYMATIKSTGILPKTKLDKTLTAYMEGSIHEGSPEFLAHSGKEQQALKSAKESLSNMSREILERTNVMMASFNLPQIADLTKSGKGYVPLIRDTAVGLKSFLRNAFSGGIVKDAQGHVDLDSYFMATADDGVMAGKAYINKTGDKLKSFLSFELKREGGNEESRLGAVESFSKYIKPMMERLHYSGLAREMDAAKSMAPNLQNLSEWMTTYKDEVLFGMPNWLDRSATNKTLGKTLNWTRRHIAEGTILFNTWTSAQQLLSSPLNFAVSGKNGAKAMVQYAGKASEEAYALSNMIKIRDPIEDIKSYGMGSLGQKMQGLLRAGYRKEAVKELGSYAMQTFDKVVFKHAYLTGYYTGLEKGLGPKEAARFGDWWASAIQGDLSATGTPAFARTTLGRAAFQFQSFTNNYAMAMLNDLPSIASRDGAGKAASMVIKTVAGVSLANELTRSMGLQPAFELDSFIPIVGSARMGGPAPISIPVQTIGAVVDYAKGEKDAASTGKQLLRTLSRMAFPGSSSLYKAVDAAANHDYNSDHELYRAILFGHPAANRAEKLIKTENNGKGIGGKLKGLHENIREKTFGF